MINHKQEVLRHLDLFISFCATKHTCTPWSLKFGIRCHMFCSLLATMIARGEGIVDCASLGLVLEFGNSSG